MRKFLFIINPVAGKGVTKNMIPIINKVFKEHIMDMKISKFIGDATQIAIENSEKYTDIISVGGDGTLTEVINGLSGYEGNLGIIPAGTGNDFARTLELPEELTACLGIILDGKVKYVDVPKINNNAFINVASFGIDGGIIVDTDKIKQKITGTPAYVFASLKGILNYKPYKVIMEIDELKIEREIVIAAVGNGKYFGGGMKVAPMAQLDDGLLDVVIANKTNKTKLIKLFIKLFKGTHMSDPIVEHYRCKKFVIKSNETILINTDGNLIGNVPAEVSIGTEKIAVLIP